MKAEEELTLPPWEKFLKYGLFPFKLSIHLALLAIVTSLVLLVNISFSGYSRAIWMSMVNVLYPPDYANFQLDTSSPYQYYLYTQNQTVRDVNYLLNNYFQLPDISVNNIKVYNSSYFTGTTDNSYSEDNQGILPPLISITSSDGSQEYIIYSPDDNDGFPLAYNNIGQIPIKSFFHDLKTMTIEVYVKSYGITDTSHANSENICFHWKWSFFYHANNLAQISVNAKASILSHCDGYQLPSSATIYALSLALLILAIWYQILLIKAVWRQLILLNMLRASRWEVLLLQQQQQQQQEMLQSAGVVGNISTASSVASNKQYSKNGKKSLRKSSRNSSTSYRARMFHVDHEDQDEEDDEKGAQRKRQQGEETDEDDDEGESKSDRGSSQHRKGKLTQAKDSATSGNLFEDALRLSHSHPKTRKSQEHEDNEEDEDEEDEHVNALMYSRSNSEVLRGSSISQASTSTTQRARQLTFASVIEEDWHLLQQALHSLTWQDKLLIVNLWFVIGTIGNFFALLFAGRMVVNHSDIMAERFLKIGLGLSCLAYWCSLVQYLEFFPRYYIMISMLKITVPRVSQFLLGVLPLFFGYALLGMTCFSDVSVKFGDILETLRTLFSVVNGDIIYDTFYDIEDAGLGGQLYVYLYILLFTYVVLMTIIAIVEEAFFEAQEQKSITNSTSSNAVVSRSKKRGDSDEVLESEGVESNNNSNRPSDITGGGSGRGSLNGGKREMVEGDDVVLGGNSANNSYHFSASNSANSAANNQGAVLGGKRNLPDHVRFLLQNVDKLPSSSSTITSNTTLKQSQASPQKPLDTSTPAAEGSIVP